MEFVRDFLGNKICIGDEVIYIPYNGTYYLDRSCIRKAVSFTKKNTIIVAARNSTREIKRFIKAIREEEV